MKDKSYRYGIGFTILEALVVIGLIAAIVLVAAPSLYRMYNAYKAQSASSSMATNLRFLRNAAVKQKILYRVVIRDSAESPPNTYSVLYDPGRSNNPVTPFTKIDTKLPEGVVIVSPSLDQIDFNVRGGVTVSPTGQTIILESPDKTQYRISISSSGAVTVTKL